MSYLFLFCTQNPFIFACKKGVQKVYEKLLAHPLFVSVYVVYYARVARTFILVSLLCVCVCVCVLHFYLDLPNKWHKKMQRILNFFATSACYM